VIRQLEVFLAYQLSHLSAEVNVGIDAQLPVGGCMNLAFVGPYRNINGASASMVLADAPFMLR